PGDVTALHGGVDAVAVVAGGVDRRDALVRLDERGDVPVAGVGGERRGEGGPVAVVVPAGDEGVLQLGAAHLAAGRVLGERRAHRVPLGLDLGRVRAELVRAVVLGDPRHQRLLAGVEGVVLRDVGVV